jgi:hypothetical protein
MKKNYDFRKVNNGFTIEERSGENRWDVTGRYVVETESDDPISDETKLVNFIGLLIHSDMKNLRFDGGSIEVEIEELKTPEAPTMEPQGECIGVAKSSRTEEEYNKLPF